MQEVFTDAKRSLRCPTDVRVIPALGAELSVTEKASFHAWGVNELREALALSTVGSRRHGTRCALANPQIMGVVLGNKHKTLLHLCARPRGFCRGVP